MLSKDQVQMVASNQQAAGVFCTAAESHRRAPSPVAVLRGRVKCSSLYKISITHPQNDSGAHFSVTK